ncbi:MAG: RICIN domain-containing protein, partial [Fretibacterium sp.]|nr:RICIN domain-containing protein [Fretibacterium sp.]
VLNGYQFLILFGVLLFIVLGRGGGVTFFYRVTFVGGFVFHTFWEAKAIYALSYFALLLPLAVEGYGGLILCAQKGGRTDARLRCGALAACVAVAAVLISGWRTPWLEALLLRDEDTGAYREYLARHTDLRVADGRYRLRPAGDTSLLLRTPRGRAGQNGQKNARVSIADAAVAYGDLNLTFSRFDDFCYIQFRANQKYLDVSENKAEEGQEVQAYEGNRSAAQRWRLRDAKMGAVNVIFGADMALTYDLETRRAFLSRYAPSVSRAGQAWILERVD